MLSDLYAGAGIADLELKWLIAQLPQFDHIVLNSSGARGWKEIAQNDGRCIPAAVKSPARQKVAAFSNTPAVTSWGVMLMTRQDRFPALAELRTASGEIDLARLIGRNDLHGVVNKGRSYGTLIDPMLGTPEGRVAVQPVSDSQQALHMVTAGRADYAVGYPHELNYFQRLDSAQGPIVALPIAGQDRFAPGFVACSDKILGRTVIDAVNAVLSRAGTPPPYMNEARQWYSDKEFAEISAPARWMGP